MDKRQEILKKHEEFHNYLKSIDLNELKELYSRDELNELKSKLYEMDTDSFAYQISDLIERMKVEEYPELLGVHHFPIIKEIDFLTEEKKIELDEFLVRHRVGNFVQGLWRITENEKTCIQLEDWLLEHKVIEENFAVLCPHCGNDPVSDLMNKEEKEKFDTTLQEYSKSGDWDLYEEILNVISFICMDCEYDFEINVESVKNLKYKKVNKMIMSRDTSLDNV